MTTCEPDLVFLLSLVCGGRVGAVGCAGEDFFCGWEWEGCCASGDYLLPLPWRGAGILADRRGQTRGGVIGRIMDRSEQELLRIESLNALRELGIDPYPAAEYGVTHSTASVLEDFERLAMTKEKVRVAGRVRSRRIMGSASFMSVQDEHGSLQVYVRRDAICQGGDDTLYNTVFKKLLDLGDIVGVEGYMFSTQTGERSLHAERITLLAKSIRPLPVVKEKDGKTFDAFTDPELRYRQRYLDLALNADTRMTFRKRQQIIDTMRAFFNEHGYLEVETPILQSLPGGASARPFITHHNALDIPLYLRIADELYLKRLIVGGYDGVYEFAKDFRNEGMDRTHNPEFSMVEIYVAYKDYFWMMDFTERMLERAALAVHGKTEFMNAGNEISFRRPFRRLTMRDAIREYAGIDIRGMGLSELRGACGELGVEYDETMGVGKLIDEIFGAKCEEHLIQPTFLIDYPIELSPLCKRHRDDPTLTERFELFVNGHELCNAYSELNDPLDQYERFKDQMELAVKGDEEAMRIDHDYIRAMEYGMPPCSGMGIGIDRLVMLLLNKPSIQDVLLFPQMRPERRAERDDDAAFEAAGVPREWIPAVRGLGYNALSALRAAKVNKLLNDLRGYAKKNKLGVPALTPDALRAWGLQE